jgi:hypothetical protein
MDNKPKNSVPAVTSIAAMITTKNISMFQPPDFYQRR